MPDTIVIFTNHVVIVSEILEELQEMLSFKIQVGLSKNENNVPRRNTNLFKQNQRQRVIC